MNPSAIRFGPAAAPRWFDGDLSRFGQYLDLITSNGAKAIEFVALPDDGTEEERRVHLGVSNWPDFTALAQNRGLQINVHWPLVTRYRLDVLENEQGTSSERIGILAGLIDHVATGQDVAPNVVVHAISESQSRTATALNRFRALLTRNATICVEQRIPLNAEDQRFDRSLTRLASVLDSDLSICWDIANEWSANDRIELPPAENAGRVRHLHVHDSRPDRTLHAPLDSGQVPWRKTMRDLLSSSHWQGSITLEIRYRYASEVGEPWTVLADSLQRVRSVLTDGAD